MKKSAILLVSILLISCDKIEYDTFTIKNNCPETINVEVISINDSMSFEVEAYAYYHFDTIEGIGRPKKNVIEFAFNKISAEKDGVISLKNFIKTREWICIETTEHHYEWTLPINPEDFE